MKDTHRAARRRGAAFFRRRRHGCSLTAEPNWGLEQKVLPDIISHTVYTLAHSKPPVVLLWEMMISVWFWLEMPQKMATCLVRVIYVWN